MQSNSRSMFDQLVLAIAAVLILGTAHLLAQKQGSVDSRRSASSDLTAGTRIVIPFFAVNTHFSSTLVMINSVRASTFAYVSVRSAAGVEIARKKVLFDPHSQQRIDLADLLQLNGVGSGSGSIVVIMDPKLKSPAIGAVLSITFHSPQGDVYVDEKSESPNSSILQAVSGVQTGEPIVSIVSTSTSDQLITMHCFSDEGHFVSADHILAAEHTLFTKGCTEELQDGLPDDSFARGSNSPRVTTGIAISASNGPGQFAAFAVAPKTIRGGTLVTSVPFTDPTTIKSSTTLFVGVPLGNTAELPNGSYTAHLSVANFDSVDHEVNVWLASTQSGKSQKQQLKGFTVRAKSTLSATLPPEDNVAGLANSFIVTSDASPGKVQAKLVSKAESPEREVTMLGKDENDPQNGGAHPWSTEDNHTSTILLFNRTDRPEQFGVQIADGATDWEKAYTLNPLETREISINALISNRQKDDYGQIIPKTLNRGHVSWFTQHLAAGRGRLLLSNEDGTMARSFSCGQTYRLCDAYIDLSDSSFAVGSVGGNGYFETDYCQSDGNRGCTGEESNKSKVATFSWTSGNSSIAAMNGSTTTSTSSMLRMSGGNTTTNVIACDSTSCCKSGTGPVTVQSPTYFFSPSYTNTTAAPGTCSGKNGTFIDVQFYVADQIGNRINTSGLEPGENYGAGWNTSFSTPLTTRSDGSFDDTPFGSCYGFTGHYCGLQTNRIFQITVLPGYYVYPISTKTTQKFCTDGVQLVIQGNPSTPTNQNKTYTVGNVQ